MEVDDPGRFMLLLVLMFGVAGCGLVIGGWMVWLIFQ